MGKLKFETRFGRIASNTTAHIVTSINRKSINAYKKVKRAKKHTPSSKAQMKKQVEADIKKQILLRDSTWTDNQKNAIDYKLHLLAIVYEKIGGYNHKIHKFIITNPNRLDQLKSTHAHTEDLQSHQDKTVKVDIIKKKSSMHLTTISRKKQSTNLKNTAKNGVKTKDKKRTVLGQKGKSTLNTPLSSGQSMKFLFSTWAQMRDPYARYNLEKQIDTTITNYLNRGGSLDLIKSLCKRYKFPLKKIAGFKNFRAK